MSVTAVNGRSATVRNISGLLFALVSLVAAAMLIPAAIAIYNNETAVLPSFLLPPTICTIIWGLRFLYDRTTNHIRREKLQLTVRAGIFVVAGGWLCSCILGAIPLFFSGAVTTISDAFFESASGFTTTGATVITNVESIPRSVNVWRAETHWLGGMGIVALTVAILPLLGVGGFRLIKSETTGPEKGKFTPKITETAKILWIIYTGLTVLQTILLMIAGMDFIDSLLHSFATLGTGGFSSRNASIGAYNSSSIEWICTVFMFLSGINFSLYYWIFAGRISELRRNTELKVYIAITVISGLIISLCLLPTIHSVAASFRIGFFQVVSIITTTGFSTVDFCAWRPLPQVVLLLLMCIGGCSGSTGGGIKVIRWVIAGRQMTSEMRKMLHPHGIFGIRINGKSYSKDIVQSIMAFLFLYSGLVAATTVIAAAGGADLITAVTAALSMVGNIGPGFGAVGPTHTFEPFAPAVKWCFSFAMIAGRLELYTIMIFFSPSFWKK